MKIQTLFLATSQLLNQKAFYTEVLGLPLVREETTSFTVQAGETALTFAATGQEAIYHVAFMVPSAKWERVKEWTRARVPILEYQGGEEFRSENWNSASIYFYDAAGNILEFIAHYDLPDASTGAFSSSDILRVCEIGLVVGEVEEQEEKLKQELHLDVYRNSRMEGFAAVGDIYGLFIVVKEGRLWLPNFVVPATIAPVQVTISGDQPGQYSIEPYPYTIDVVTAKK
ncbi:catechol-2,3-dioxygenase [Thermosporothrix hazakensis]|jgi:catechol-2,3-dioxygenase|uniref:Catechol-2,3-dioxygenase n=1 Tax=Thermosporothrix hazakensis TaxID=644383 RepID=A0A326U791_THEHA|nr:VOC family protein [Thermosporothrix hazakensis]PZW29392.1 catechol-2,3-dioxygenase [Thermosporothrix hazakensis]GCE45893.1 hypothetical protein KTH_07620 [Thermosporothrix hazakensis]